MINKSVQQILKHKAKLIIRNQKLSDRYRKLIEELNISSMIDAALLGAVDAMIYDIACSLDFTKQKGKVSDWSSYPSRESLIKEIWKRKDQNDDK